MSKSRHFVGDQKNPVSVFQKPHPLFPHKRLHHRKVNALSEVDEGVVVHHLGAAVDADLFVFDVEAKVQMLRGILHAHHHTVFIKQRTAALSA